ncbi:Crp/Fnr family transcriptional regulator [Actinomadura graeca]|uniref:Crp/Fnr family transcriptional regulator n=1 Tax=Actinomadura graeca TaxID=2750812 RepID=A0ABX8R0C5_9ACTN|nr:Crp/Fnr family transcriptional regulator [Actinomadura graeca]QXJ23422.1 Crp/Fnr family transcriptional regulator [Actinomadura graeca]
MAQGDPADHVLLLTHGRVKIWRDEDDGKRILLAVRWPLDLLGARGMLGAGVRTASVEALDACEARQISADRFRALVDRLGLRGVLFQYLAAHLQESEDLRADRTAVPARRQVARFLVRLAETASLHAGRDATGLGLGIRQNDIAAALGLVRQTVGQELKALHHDGIIDYDRGMIVVRDRERLLSRI